MQGYDWQEEAARKQETRRFFSAVGFSVLALIVATHVAQFVLVLATQLVCPQWIVQWWYSWVLSFVPLYGVGLPCFLLTIRYVPVTPHENAEADATPPFAIKWWWVLLLVSVGYMYIGSFVGQGLMNAIAGMLDKEYTNSLNTLVEQSPVWATVLGTVILAPLGEEFLFRKVLIDRTRRYGDTVSVLLSATFFALFHIKLYQMFYAFLIGLVLGYLYTRTGKLRWSVAMHMALNAIGGLLMPLVVSLLLPSGAEPTGLQLALVGLLDILIYGVAIASVVMTVKLRRRLVLRGSRVPLSRDSFVSAVLSAAGVAVTVAVCASWIVQELI